jgi:hypothetical protein
MTFVCHELTTCTCVRCSFMTYFLTRSRCQDKIERVEEELSQVGRRTTFLEDAMPDKAERAELEAAIKEIKEEIEKLNIEESMSTFFVLFWTCATSLFYHPPISPAVWLLFMSASVISIAFDHFISLESLESLVAHSLHPYAPSSCSG